MDVENIGIITNVDIVPYRTSTLLIQKISLKRVLPRTDVQQMMKYNVFTLEQLATITGKSYHRIQYASTPQVKKDKSNPLQYDTIPPKLDRCYPFHQIDSKPPKFIYRNEKCEKFILESIE